MSLCSENNSENAVKCNAWLRGVKRRVKYKNDIAGCDIM